MLKRILLAGLALICASAADAAMVATRIPTHGAPNCIEASSFIARLSPPPSNAMRAKYNAAICGLVKSATWPKLDAFYVLAAENATAASLNLVSRSYTIVPHGTTTFGPLVGYMGDGSTGYLDTQFVPSTAGGKWTLNGASLAVLMQNQRTAKLNQIQIGTQTSTSTLGSSIITIYGDGNNYASMNGAATGLGAANNALTNGTWIVTRTGAATEVLYRNGVSYQSTASGDTAAGLSNQSVYILAATGPSPPTPAGPAQDTVGAAAFGGALTAADATALHAAMNLFYNDIPALAAYWGFTATSFNDQSFASIDSTNTGGTNFIWYPAGAPGGTSGTGWFTSCCGEILTAAGDITVSNNTVTLNGHTTGVYSSRIISRGFDGTVGGKGSQRAFPAGGYMSGTFAFDPTLHNTTNGNPITWYQAMSINAGQSLGTSGDRGIEIDINEAVAGLYTNALIDWTTAGSGTTGTNNSIGKNGAGCCPSPQLFTQQHEYGVVWVLSTQNGGTGLVTFLIDGIVVNTNTYTATTGSTPVATPSNPNGVFFDGESNTFAFLIDGGYNWPGTFSRVRRLCNTAVNC